VTAVTAPTDISGCVLWLDGADSSAASMTLNGSLVETWKDKSGAGNNATATGTARPTLTGSGLNGKSVLTFDGSANAMQIAANAAFNTNDVTYIVVFKQGAAANKGVYTKLNASAGTNGFGLVVRSDPQIWLLQKNAGGAQVLTSSANPTTQARIYSVTSSSSATGYLDGLSSATSASTADHSLVQRVMVGSRDSSEYLNGYIAEVIHYNRVLTRTELAQVEALLATKWGVSGVHAQATASSDPVGYWADKSGKGNNVSIATSTKRPIVGTQNNRKALTFDGSDDNLNATPVATVGATEITVVAVVKNNLTSQPTYLSAAWLLNSGNSGRPIERWQTSSQNGALVAASFTAVTSPFRSLSDRFIHVFDGKKDGISSGSHQLREFINGAAIFDVANSTGTWSTSSQKFNIGTRDDAGTQYKGDICEVCVYDKRLTTAERQRLERYLSARWGITLAPQVSNADAQDWINRVYANGGSVSASTASAVNQFCNDIDAAGIRSSMYRANLFCGTGLNACLVPLYRGPSLSGTQYGNTTDTNVGPFVSGDYNETGASGGLQSNGTSKYLNTGLKADVLGQADRHLSCVADTSTFSNNSKYLIGTDNFGCGGNAFWGIMTGGASISQAMIRAHNAASNSTAFNVSGKAHILVSGNGSASAYLNGSAAVTGPSGTFTAPAYDIYTHALNRCGSAGDYTSVRLLSYSVGAAMTAAQAASFYTAMAAFNTSMARS
jgi:hypothetical protein